MSKVHHIRVVAVKVNAAMTWRCWRRNIVSVQMVTDGDCTFGDCFSRTVVLAMQLVEIRRFDQILLSPRSTAQSDPTKRLVKPVGVVVYEDAPQRDHDHAAEHHHHCDPSHPVRRATLSLAGVEVGNIRWCHD